MKSNTYTYRNDHQKSKPVIKDKFCFFCVNGIRQIDYKETSYLKKFMTPYGKIAPRRRIGTCAKHHRQLTTAIKRARIMALLPFTR
ncbi:MAG: 30S ribosomal protein S18 [bacterium]